MAAGRLAHDETLSVERGGKRLDVGLAVGNGLRAAIAGFEKDEAGLANIAADKTEE